MCVTASLASLRVCSCVDTAALRLVRRCLLVFNLNPILSVPHVTEGVLSRYSTKGRDISSVWVHFHNMSTFCFPVVKSL